MHVDQWLVMHVDPWVHHGQATCTLLSTRSAPTAEEGVHVFLYCVLSAAFASLVVTHVSTCALAGLQLAVLQRQQVSLDCG